MFDNFVKEKEFTSDLVEKYKKIVPDEIIDIWIEKGMGSFFDGYLKVINPDDYKDLIKNTYFRGEKAIPLFITAFGDIITWEKGEYVSIVNYKNGTFNIMIKGMKNFIRCLGEDYFINKFFDVPMYNQAVQKQGKLAYDECFGYVPLLGLGGSKKAENLRKVKIREHIELITQLVGKIGM